MTPRQALDELVRRGLARRLKSPSDPVDLPEPDPDEPSDPGDGGEGGDGEGGGEEGGEGGIDADLQAAMQEAEGEAEGEGGWEDLPADVADETGADRAVFVLTPKGRALAKKLLRDAKMKRKRRALAKKKAAKKKAPKQGRRRGGGRRGGGGKRRGRSGFGLASPPVSATPTPCPLDLDAPNTVPCPEPRIALYVYDTKSMQVRTRLLPGTPEWEKAAAAIRKAGPKGYTGILVVERTPDSRTKTWSTWNLGRAGAFAQPRLDYSRLYLLRSYTDAEWREADREREAWERENGATAVGAEFDAPTRRRVGNKIKILLAEGRPRRQAVAIALNMARSGRL